MKTKYIPLLLLILFINACSKDDLRGTNNSDITLANKQTTGSSANDLLSSTIFKSMIIEVVYVEGYEPTTTAINNFKSFIEARTYKPDGVTVVKRSIPTPGNATYSLETVRDIEDANRTEYNEDDAIAVWVFFTDGKSDKDTNDKVVLGTAYRNTSFVIFEKTIQGLSNSALEPSRSLLETTVITHEFGHILGLTNFGTAMQTEHEDAEHPNHCDEETCLMHWTTASGSSLSNLAGSNAPQLDAQCIADLQANGGK